jgi:hypothetical protein
LQRTTGQQFTSVWDASASQLKTHCHAPVMLPCAIDSRTFCHSDPINRRVNILRNLANIAERSNAPFKPDASRLVIHPDTNWMTSFSSHPVQFPATESMFLPNTGATSSNRISSAKAGSKCSALSRRATSFNVASLNSVSTKRTDNATHACCLDGRSIWLPDSTMTSVMRR